MPATTELCRARRHPSSLLLVAASSHEIMLMVVSDGRVSRTAQGARAKRRDTCRRCTESMPLSTFGGLVASSSGSRGANPRSRDAAAGHAGTLSFFSSRVTAAVGCFGDPARRSGARPLSISGIGLLGKSCAWRCRPCAKHDAPGLTCRRRHRHHVDVGMTVAIAASTLAAVGIEELGPNTIYMSKMSIGVKWGPSSMNDRVLP